MLERQTLELTQRFQRYLEGHRAFATWLMSGMTGSIMWLFKGCTHTYQVSLAFQVFLSRVLRAPNAKPEALGLKP